MKLTLKAVGVFIFSLAFASCAKEKEVIPQTSNPVTETGEGIGGTAIIKVDEDLAAILEEAAGKDDILTKSESVNSLIRSLGIVSYERLYPDAGEYEERTRLKGLHRWYIINYDSSIPATKASADFAAAKGVCIVEHPHRIKRCALPNDPYFKWQWDLYNDKSLNLTIKDGRRTVSSNEGCDINVNNVWDYTSGNPSVIVSVIDGGVDLAHPDIAANCIPAGVNGSWNFINDSRNVTADGHGTHVAGTIAAVRNNNLGVAGIAGGDYAAGAGGVKILSCQVFAGDNSASDPGFMRAIKYGADHGAVICNNSWGHSYDCDEDGFITDKGIKEAASDAISSYEKEGIDYFIEFAGCDNSGKQRADSPMKGGLVIFAAGNDGIKYGVPADYEPVLAVGASGPDWKPAWYSNYGSWIDICAPGGDGYGGNYGNDHDAAGYSRGNIFNLYQTAQDSDYDYTSYGYMLGTSMATPHVSGVAALLLSYFGGPGFTADELRKMLIDGANPAYINNTTYVGPALDAWGAFQQGPGSPDVPDPVTSFNLTPDKRSIKVECTVPSDPDDGKPSQIIVLVSKDAEKLASANPNAPGPDIIASSLNVGDLTPGSTLAGSISGLDYATTYYVALYASDRSKNYSASSEIKSVTMPEDHAPIVVSQPEGILIYSTMSMESLELGSLFSDSDGDVLEYSFDIKDHTMLAASIEGTSLKLVSKDLGITSVTVIASDGFKDASFIVPVLIKSPSNPAETYPSPVTDVLTIRTEQPAPTHVLIVNSTGKAVYESTTTFSGFSPLTINMAGLAPGRYGVLVEYNQKSIKKTVIKR